MTLTYGEAFIVAHLALGGRCWKPTGRLAAYLLDAKGNQVGTPRVTTLDRLTGKGILDYKFTTTSDARGDSEWTLVLPEKKND